LPEESQSPEEPESIDAILRTVVRDASPRPGAAPWPDRNFRRRVVIFGASLAFLSFLDRAAISQMAPAISRELHLSTVQMGLAFSAFGFTYSLCEIPSGWLCDRFGARWLLTRVVVMWSILTAATGLAWNFSSLMSIRLLFGAGESGCFPGLARVFKTWLKRDERNSAEGVKAAAARWGAAITPALIAGLYRFMNWRQVFMLFGFVGILWALLFFRWYRDRPVAGPGANERESGLRDFAGSIPGPHRMQWLTLLRSRSVWALGLQWFCHYYGFYFYITWLPLYLYQGRGLKLQQEAWAAGMPLFGAGLGSLFAGWALTALTRKIGSTARARKWLGYAAYGGAAVLLLLFTAIENSLLAIFVMSLSSFAAEFSGPVSWTTAMDIGGERVGTVSGFMNMLGHFGGSVAPALTGLLLSASGNAWTTVFFCSAFIYAAGALCWAFIDPVTPVMSELAGG
jgi:ACS family glucarate transporter-like MFS transporter